MKAPILMLFLALTMSCTSVTSTSATQSSSLNTSSLQSGPMLGYMEMREALIWLQTENASEVYLEYQSVGNQNETPEIVKSETQLSESGMAFTLKFILSNLEPGTPYQYWIYVDGNKLSETYSFETQMLWQYRTDPPEFSFATGSCTYVNEKAYDRPGKGYGNDSHEIFNSIVSKNPQMMLWLGDNIYLREVDLNSKSGIYHRYSHARAIPEMRNLLSFCPQYAIWDDHDYGPNDSDRSFIHKDWTLEAFSNFWGNPENGHDLGGITTQFTFNDIDFFLLDNRWNRTAHDGVTTEPQMLGSEQMDWLIESLKFSKAPFKMIACGGMMVSDLAIYENYAQYEAERTELLRRINAENITGVIFLTGDRHHTELSRLELENGNPVYDLTVSPLTSTSYDHSQEENNNRVPDTVVGERNFATITYTGKRKERVMTIKIFNTKGEFLWEKSIDSAEWSED